MSWIESGFRGFLARADVQLNGKRPWDMQINDPRVFGNILRAGSLGLGESYMAGGWDSKKLDEFFARILRARLSRYFWFNPAVIFEYFRNLFKKVDKQEAFKIGEAHYDLGNDFFKAMLDLRLVYSCGYWPARQARPSVAGGVPGVKNLAEAQAAKLDLVCRKLGLKKGQRILEIGCGWGSLAKFAAENYGVSVVGITVSKEQAELARKLCAKLPVEIRVADYRELNESFDHVVSIGMFEHVEYKNHRVYFEVVSRCLKPGGLFLLHTIGKEWGGLGSDPWIRKYIFPVGIIPSAHQIRRATQGLFSILDWHAFGGSHYDQTLMAWHKNFSKNWPKLAERYAGKVNGQFERMWRYYLLSCAGAFRSGNLDLYQVVLAKGPRAYSAVR